MTTHGRTGFKRLLFGSVAEAVLRETGVPVFLMRQNRSSDRGASWTAAEPRLTLPRFSLLASPARPRGCSERKPRGRPRWDSGAPLQRAPHVSTSWEFSAWPWHRACLVEAFMVAGDVQRTDGLCSRCEVRVLDELRGRGAERIAHGGPSVHRCSRSRRPSAPTRSRSRPWHLRWGATDAEVARRWPGDELVANPATRAVRAVTVDAPAATIWPWIMQVGRERGGFYSYTWLENLIGADIRNADRPILEVAGRRAARPSGWGRASGSAARAADGCGDGPARHGPGAAGGLRPRRRGALPRRLGLQPRSRIRRRDATRMVILTSRTRAPSSSGAGPFRDGTQDDAHDQAPGRSFRPTVLRLVVHRRENTMRQPVAIIEGSCAMPGGRAPVLRSP